MLSTISVGQNENVCDFLFDIQITTEASINLNFSCLEMSHPHLS